jgi:hypothetical protein
MKGGINAQRHDEVFAAKTLTVDQQYDQVQRYRPPTELFQLSQCQRFAGIASAVKATLGAA